MVLMTGGDCRDAQHCWMLRSQQDSCPKENFFGHCVHCKNNGWSGLPYFLERIMDACKNNGWSGLMLARIMDGLDCHISLKYKRCKLLWWLSGKKKICLLMQETQIWSLAQEDPTCHIATKLVGHNYRACALEPGIWSCWAYVPQLLKRVCPGVQALQQEKTLKWEARTQQPESGPHSPQLEKVLAATKTQQSHKKDLRDWPEALALPTIIQLILTLL